MAAAAFSAVVFLGLTYLSIRSLPADLPPGVIVGKQAWQRGGCMECHTLFGNGGYNAPDLTKVTERHSDSYITDWLTTAKVVRPTTKTAHMAVSPADAEALLSFFKYLATVPNRWEAQPSRGAGR